MNRLFSKALPVADGDHSMHHVTCNSGFLVTGMVYGPYGRPVYDSDCIGIDMCIGHIVTIVIWFVPLPHCHASYIS